MNSVERVKAICKERKIPISRLERDLGYANGYIGQLRKGVFPGDRLQEIADYLDLSIEYLMTGEEGNITEDAYYFNDDARELAEFLFKHPEYKVLFDASRKVRKEDIAFVKEFMDRMRGDSDDTGC